MGIGGVSAMGSILFGISPFLSFIQRFVPRVLDGFLLGYIFPLVRKVGGTPFACLATGFFSAFLNTIFFMTALILIFGNTEYMQNLIGGQNIIKFVCMFVGTNALCEMISSTFITGAIGAALYKSKFVPSASSRKQKAI
jgi:ABC-type amino acid transport system permease subunit